MVLLPGRISLRRNPILLFCPLLQVVCNMNVLRKSLVHSLLEDPEFEGIDFEELLTTLDKIFVKGKDGEPTEVVIIMYTTTVARWGLLHKSESQLPKCVYRRAWRGFHISQPKVIQCPKVRSPTDF